MTLFSALKSNARLALRGKRGRAIGILAVSWGVWAFLSILCESMLNLFVEPLAYDATFAETFGVDAFFYENFAHTTWMEYGILTAFTMLGILLLAPLSLGVSRWFYLLVSERDPGVSEVFHYFESVRQYGRSLWLWIQLTVRCFLWAVLFYLLPCGILGASLGAVHLLGEESRKAAAISSVGVLLSGVLMVLAFVFYIAVINRYLLAAYLMSENDDIPVRLAIRNAVRFSRGYRFSLLWYQLSFFGWGLLCLLFFPLFYVIPYFYTSTAMYGRYLIEKARFTQPDATREFSVEESHVPEQAETIEPEPMAEPPEQTEPIEEAPPVQPEKPEQAEPWGEQERELDAFRFPDSRVPVTPPNDISDTAPELEKPEA